MKNKVYQFFIKLFLLFFLLLLWTCIKDQKKRQTDIDSVLKIELKKANNSFYNRSTDFLVYSYKEKYPNYYKKMIEGYKNLPKSDSFLIVSHTFQKKYLYSNLLKKNYILEDKDIQRAIHFTKDSINLFNKPFNHQIDAVSWFKGDKQIVIIDANNNNDFGDDKSYVFKNNFSFKDNKFPSIDLIDTLPIINLKHQLVLRNKVINVNRKVQVFPYPNYYTTQYYIKEDSIKKYALLLRLKDYWKGSITKNSISYKVALQGMNERYMSYIIIPDSLSTYPRNKSFNKNFRYNIKDTVSLFNSLYKIDSINSDVSILFLNKIKSNKDFFSYRLGYKLTNFQIEDLNDSKFNMDSIVTNGNKYTLLDFWGTWCKPCKELTPKLKRLNKSYSKNLNVISIALDNNKEVVKNYVNKNNINWYQGYVDRKNRKGSIINKLYITSYPTFILLDKNRKIIHRGTGEFAFKEIENILKKSLSIK